MKNEKGKQGTCSKRTVVKEYILPWSIVVTCCVLILPFLFTGCDNDEPGMIYDPDVSIDVTGKPTITGISPASVAVAGVREITITGTDLGIKNGTDTSWVVIGGVRPIFKEIQSNSITFYRPSLTNDKYNTSIYVSVTDPKMLTVSSSIGYAVELPGAVTGDYSGSQFPLLALEFDKKTPENLFTVVNRTLIRNDFAGVTPTNLLDSRNIASGDYRSITNMCFGPGLSDKNLFIAVGKSYISRITVFDTLNTTTRPQVLTTPDAVSQMDFDGNGNIYVGGPANLYFADTSVGSSATPTFTQVSGYSGVARLVKLRVINESGNEFIYYADTMHVWKSQISGTSLTNTTVLVDLNTHAELSGSYINSFDVDESNSLFLCLRNNPDYSLFFLESDGSITPYYRDPNILPKTVEKIVWGSGKYLYLLSGSLQSAGSYVAGRIYRLSLDRNGAPYRGRNFIK